MKCKYYFEPDQTCECDGNLPDELISVKSEYDRGFQDALKAYAWWKDGEEYLGTTGTKLKEVINNLNMIFNYKPPKGE